MQMTPVQKNIQLCVTEGWLLWFEMIDAQDHLPILKSTI